MNTFGRVFRVSIFGESHGPAVGVVIDGVEPGVKISEEDFKEDIGRRRGGAAGTTPRIEEDIPEILSGVYGGHTTGAPLAIVFRNGNTRSEDYSKFKDIPRPGHADWTADFKYGGFNDPRGGGHFSGRLTLPVVAAGVVAKKVLSEVVEEETGGEVKFSCNAKIVELGGSMDPEMWDGLIAGATAEGDSLGAVVECRIDGIPAGLGEPFWDSVESGIAHAVFSIPGVRAVEFGDGFKAAAMKGSEHNDTFPIDTEINHAGGVNGGITNGAPVVFRVAFKPTSSIRRPQTTQNFASGKPEVLEIPGRHDVCFALRAPVVVEAMAAIVLADLVDLA